jgi:hypothetical protein
MAAGLAGSDLRDWLLVTAEQSLVGAMGCASWRAHYRVREYIDLAPSGGVIRGGPTNAPSMARPDALGLNEVGVTDSVMTALWRFGPNAAAFAVSSGAESNHLGADIAIVHSGSTRVLVYQAKLASLVNDQFTLKSKVTVSQARMLRRKSVTLGGLRHGMTGRLALYHADSTPFIDHCHHRFGFDWRYRWPWESMHPGFVHDAEVGRDYYREVLSSCRCSPSGVLAAPVIATAAIESVSESATWPWEFDTYEWLRRSSPLDSNPGSDHRSIDREGTIREPPDFDGYRAAPGQPLDDPAELARELASRLRLPLSHRLFVVVL